MGFLKKHPLIITFLLFFCAVQVFPFVYKGNGEGHAVYKVVMSVNHYIYAAVHGVKLSMKNLWSDYLILKDKEQENRVLRNENLKLHAELLSMQEIQMQNRRLRNLLGFTSKKSYEIVTANVVGGGLLPFRSEFLIIDRGESYGIQPGMIVVTQAGIVGKVFFVNGSSSQVMPVTDPISAVDAVVQRTRARGIVKGSGSGCVLEYLEGRSSAKTGDIVITSGKDGLPKGIPIGKVASMEKQGGLFKAKVFPEVSVNSLEEVLVVKQNL